MNHLVPSGSCAYNGAASVWTQVPKEASYFAMLAKPAALMSHDDRTLLFQLNADLKRANRQRPPNNAYRQFEARVVEAIDQKFRAGIELSAVEAKIRGRPQNRIFAQEHRERNKHRVTELEGQLSESQSETMHWQARYAEKDALCAAQGMEIESLRSTAAQSQSETKHWQKRFTERDAFCLAQGSEIETLRRRLTELEGKVQRQQGTEKQVQYTPSDEDDDFSEYRQYGY